MTDGDWLAQRFEAHRSRLRAVALRMLGSGADADDALQEAWLRLSRSDAAEIENLAGWLTTVVSRVCLNMLQSRTTRREDPLADELNDDPSADPTTDPEREALLADSVGSALLVVLDTLGPAERLAFVLHDMFAVPFDDVAVIVGRSPAAVRQLASRARRRVQGAAAPDPDRSRQREVVAAFLAASRAGDFEGLLALLDPGVVLRSDAVAAGTGAPELLHGADAVAQTFAGRAKAARLALVDGSPGLVWSQGGRPRVVFALTIADGRIGAVEIVADPQRLDEMDLVLLRS